MKELRLWPCCQHTNSLQLNVALCTCTACFSWHSNCNSTYTSCSSTHIAIILLANSGNRQSCRQLPSVVYACTQGSRHHLTPPTSAPFCGIVCVCVGGGVILSIYPVRVILHPDPCRHTQGLSFIGKAQRSEVGLTCIQVLRELPPNLPLLV
jgi:hypothetical protein